MCISYLIFLYGYTDIRTIYVASCIKFSRNLTKGTFLSTLIEKKLNKIKNVSFL